MVRVITPPSAPRSLDRRRAAGIVEEVEHRPLEPRPAAVIGAVERADPVQLATDRPPGEVAVEYARIDVGAPSHGGRVAEHLGDAADRAVDHAPRARWVAAVRPSAATETAASTVAFHVRKSLALNSSPITALR